MTKTAYNIKPYIQKPLNAKVMRIKASDKGLTKLACLSITNYFNASGPVWICQVH